MSEVFFLKGAWRVVWRSKAAPIEFNCKGAALAYVAMCDRLGRLRA
jgi:hypothetical protein